MMHQVLKAGQSMIGLQYGTNKGASQVSFFSEQFTKKERSMKKRAGNIFSEYATEKYQVFPLFRLVWLPMEPPGRSDQRVSFIQHLSSTFDTKLHCSRFWSGVIFHHIVIIFWHPNTSSNFLIELPIKQTRCSCQWKYVKQDPASTMQKTGWTINSFFLVLSGLKKSFTLVVITRGQTTTIFLCIGPFLAWWWKTKQTNNRVILVQACSWPVWEGSLLQSCLVIIYHNIY